MKLSYEPVTQKFVAHLKSETECTLYGDLPDILGFGAGSGDSSTSLSRRRLVRCLYEATPSSIRGVVSNLRLFEHRRAAYRRRQDCTATTNSADNRTVQGDGDGPFRPRPVHSRTESRIRQRRNRYKGQVPFERGKVIVMLHPSTAQLRAINLNYDDYYARQVVGHNLTLPALVSRGGMGLEVCSVVSSDRLDHLIRRGVVALGKRALRLERRLLAMSWLVKTKEDGKTKGNACRKRPDAKYPQHTSTYR